jgi:hypothetical protein
MPETTIYDIYAYINLNITVSNSMIPSEETQSFSGNIPLSQIQTSGGSRSFSDRFNIPPCHPNDSVLSGIDINNIAMSHNPNGSTQNQCQSLSVPLAQQSVDRAYSSANLDTPRDIIDDISSTLTHTSDQDINNVDNSSETSESQSIDINAININNYVLNDCDSLPIDIDEIATRGRESEREMEGERDKEREQGNDVNGREKEGKTDRENEEERETEKERDRENDKSDREKRRKKKRKSEEKTEGTKRRKKERESDGRNDSVFTDEVGDTIASRTKQRRRNRQQDDDDEDDDNNSYEY